MPSLYPDCLHVGLAVPEALILSAFGVTPRTRTSCIFVERNFRTENVCVLTFFIVKKYIIYDPIFQSKYHFTQMTVFRAVITKKYVFIILKILYFSFILYNIINYLSNTDPTNTKKLKYFSNIFNSKLIKKNYFQNR